MVEDPGLRRGFVWGQIYIVLAIVLGIVGIISGIMSLVGEGEMIALPFGHTLFGVLTIVFSAVLLLGGIGLYGRWKLGLYLTYLTLVAFVVWQVWGLIANLVTFGGDMVSMMIAGNIIVFCVLVLIACLWFGYFYRRRSWFR